MSVISFSLIDKKSERVHSIIPCNQTLWLCTQMALILSRKQFHQNHRSLCCSLFVVYEYMSWHKIYYSWDLLDTLYANCIENIYKKEEERSFRNFGWLKYYTTMKTDDMFNIDLCRDALVNDWPFKNLDLSDVDPDFSNKTDYLYLSKLTRIDEKKPSFWSNSFLFPLLPLFFLSYFLSFGLNRHFIFLPFHFSFTYPNKRNKREEKSKRMEKTESNLKV